MSTLSSKNSKPKIIVLCGNQYQFTNWCLENKKIKNSNDVCFLKSVQNLIGQTNFKLITYGNWFERTDLDQILWELIFLHKTGKMSY